MQRKVAQAIGVLIVGIVLALPQSFAMAAQASLAGLPHFRLAPMPTQLPNLIFFDQNQQFVSLDRFRGHVVLLNLWATWCGYCMREMPTLNELQKTLGPQGLVVLPVSVDRGGIPVAAARLAREGYDALQVYADPQSQISVALRTVGIPYSILIDKQGREIGRLHGEANWMSPEAINLIQPYLYAN